MENELLREWAQGRGAPPPFADAEGSSTKHASARSRAHGLKYCSSMTPSRMCSPENCNAVRETCRLAASSAAPAGGVSRRLGRTVPRTRVFLARAGMHRPSEQRRRGRAVRPPLRSGARHEPEGRGAAC